MAELKPCPFCKGTDVYIINENIGGVPKHAECYHCRARSRDCFTEQEATEVWNRRAEDGN